MRDETLYEGEWSDLDAEESFDSVEPDEVEPWKPGPDRSWVKGAECRGLPPELWIPDEKVDAETFYEFPRFVCEQCPVRALCLNYAIETNDPHGMWGGMTPAQRVNFRRGVTAQCPRCGDTFTPGRGKLCAPCRSTLRRERDEKAEREHSTVPEHLSLR